jgi:large subunit ribosomal protein L13
MNTYIAKVNSVEQKWFLIDATGKTLGRLASQLAFRLRGKHKPEFTPNVDTGDFFVVINVEKIKVTGNKEESKIYYHYSGYPSGMKAEAFAKKIVRKPQDVLELAVKGMLPRGPMGRKMFQKLKVYKGEKHPHQAQRPTKIDI